MASPTAQGLATEWTWLLAEAVTRHLTFVLRKKKGRRQTRIQRQLVNLLTALQRLPWLLQVWTSTQSSANPADASGGSLGRAVLIGRGHLAEADPRGLAQPLEDVEVLWLASWGAATRTMRPTGQSLAAADVLTMCRRDL
ncbi:hypothetical protein CYMTET_55813 [Cymbomonas tetramitiformis]|uniref:Uncharacterized protein n=1 Tax=Cymbomonas tetramitiformis TaxID=36881 RepID=A0AAE0EML6_9CHLO|nr:hypothetical protein CYMTET_55813 [Cymbomonas tetramitiformis]